MMEAAQDLEQYFGLDVDLEQFRHFMGRYPLGLLNRRKGKWTHAGSNPARLTIFDLASPLRRQALV